MKLFKKTKRFPAIWGLLVLALVFCTAQVTAFAENADTEPAEHTQSEASAARTDNQILKFENGAAQPILTFSDLFEEGYTNEGSDILRFCVYVETDHDTDNDGRADLVKVLLQVPRPAAEGRYKAATIYNPTPYSAGVVDERESETLYEEKAFDYNLLYKEGEKRTPVSSKTTLEAAKDANPKDWNYIIPGTSNRAFGNASDQDYYLVRGFAVVNACGIGTYGSEGFELCGTDLEMESHKCVVEWLAGSRTAYTDKTQNIEIRADWSNGNVAMTGTSYGGTIPFEVATSGVEGLKTIIPVAGIADWYDYTNSQGIPTRADVHYTDTLAAANCGGSYLDDDTTVLKPGYGSYLWQVAQDEEETNGDYAPIWAVKDFTKDPGKINCSALIVHGLNDYNVTDRQSDLMMQSFAKAGKTAKLVLHQEGHTALDGHTVNGELWEEILNKWLSHYLYGIENGIENMAEVTVQSNLDGSWKTYDKWRDFTYREFPAEQAEAKTTSFIDSAKIADYATRAMNAFEEEETDNPGTSDQLYYLSLIDDMGSIYEVEFPENTTIFGVPEIHAKLMTDDGYKDGLMITAVLVDYIDEDEVFNAFITTPELEGDIPTEPLDLYEIGGGHKKEILTQARQLPTPAKVITYGWTDLKNPGCSDQSSDYTLQPDDLEPGKYYDYTFFMNPTVYTLAPGHHLALVLTTWDPYRCFLDEDYQLDTKIVPEYSFYTYSYTVDNESLKVNIPVR